MTSDLSSPRSAGSNLTEENKLDTESNGLHLELAPFGLEHIYDYESGGHHPVHLGDVYGNGGRYRVIHKLGHGGFANVWLCRDTEVEEASKYVALKILMAETSNDDCPELRVKFLEAAHKALVTGDEDAASICSPLDQFTIKGPNGSHLCFVYPLLGPNVSLGIFRSSADPDKDLRTISLQVAKALAFLHSEGICHGDMTPKNVLHRISGLEELREDEVLKLLGNPVTNPVLDASNECHNKSIAPKYLVYPINWSDVDTQYISNEICLIDFGESFEISHPPEDLGVPGSYRSPELIFEKKCGFGSDIWALGCSLCEIRTSRKLFSTFDDEDDDYLDAMVQVLGKFPEPWWSTTWEDRRRLYKDEVNEHGLVVTALEAELHEDEQVQEENFITSTIHPSVATNARSLKHMIAPGLWYMSDQYPEGNRHRERSQLEQNVFADLLGRLLEYNPEDRMSVKDAINHDWFKL